MAWGNMYDIYYNETLPDDIPIIVEDSPNEIYNWFDNNGLFPLIVFLDHEMRIHHMENDGTPDIESINEKINEMLLLMVLGCTDESACNYNIDATTEDGSCTYPEANYDCNGNCLTDKDCLGACGGYAEEDECGICEGNGGCDCADGNISCDCCCLEGNSDCSGECGGPALDDECGICNDPVCTSLGTPSPFSDGENPCQLEGEYPISTFWNSTCDLSLLSDKIISHNHFKINNLYPNPFNPVLQINYDIPQAGVIQVEILDISGSHIETLHSGFLQSGSQKISWNAESMPSGMYLVSLKSGDKSLTEKVVLLK